MSIAQHVRIFEKTPDDDFVQKRTKAIDGLVKKFFSDKTVGGLLKLAADLTHAVAKGGALPDARATEIEAVIQAESEAFVKEGQELQLLTCALLAALQALSGAKPTEDAWSIYDVLAIGLWSGLGYQLPRSEEKLEALRTELLQTARGLVLASATKSRARRDVPAVTVKMQEAYDQAKTVSGIQSGVKPTIDALRANAALDREEIDLLWWALSGWSKFANEPLKQKSPLTAVVLASLEAGTYVRRVPGEPHKQLLLRLISTDDTHTLQEVIDGVSKERDALNSAFGSHHLFIGRESLFPLITAVTSGKPGGKASANRALKISDWAARALLESAILHVGSLPNELV